MTGAEATRQSFLARFPKVEMPGQSSSHCG
jgi:hypothetical protein